MTLIRALPALLLFTSVLQAQGTRVPVGQIQACGLASGVQVLTSFPTSIGAGFGVTCITLDPNVFKLNGTLLTIALPTSSASFVDGEVPTGSIDGTNKTFGLAGTPVAGSLRLYFNGIRLAQCDPARPNAQCDYDLAGSQVTFKSGVPFPSRATDILLADYRK